MKRLNSFSEQVNILSDDSSSDAEDAGPETNQSPCSTRIDQPAKNVISEDELLRKAQMYQDYMKQIPIPSPRGSVVPFNSWTELGMSLKKLYGQPLHYLTNIQLKQLDQLRVGTSDEDCPLDNIVCPSKAEASIWLIEEVHRLSSSHHHLAKLWLNNPLYHLYVDPLFPQLKRSSR